MQAVGKPFADGVARFISIVLSNDSSQQENRNAKIQRSYSYIPVELIIIKIPTQLTYMNGSTKIFLSSLLYRMKDKVTQMLS